MFKMSKKEVGRLGGIARMKKYGNLGTPEGRKKGGINSIKANLKLNNNFLKAKNHKKPKLSALLAECIGILFGDGHLSHYQASVTTNSLTDMEHAKYIQKIFKNLFGVKAPIKHRKNQNAVNIIVSSVALVKWLNKKGMPIGNKIKNEITIPSWILKRKILQKHFMRGLFDTDGCVYIDNHKIKGVIYRNYGWAFTSYSDTLRNDVFKLLYSLGMQPTCRESQKSIYMRKRKDIEFYFAEIGSSNPKHLKRYNYGRVPKRL